MIEFSDKTFQIPTTTLPYSPPPSLCTVLTVFFDVSDCIYLFMCFFQLWTMKPLNPQLFHSSLHSQPSVEPLTHIRSSGHTENISSTELVFVFYKGDMDFMVCGGKFYFHEKKLFYSLCLIERWSLSLSLRVTF